MSATAWQALERRVHRRPSDPVVTFLAHDGARTELSARTLANNVAKAANAIADEAGPGARIGLHLPWHWQRPVWTLACWAADATVVPDGDPSDVDLVVAGPAEATGLGAAGHLWVVSLHPLGLAQPVPAGALSAATIAMSQPDALLMPSRGDVPALDFTSLDVTSLDITSLEDADQARLLGIAGGRAVPARFAVVGDPADPLDRWLLPTVIPLANDASIVMLESADDAPRLLTAESATLLD